MLEHMDSAVEMRTSLPLSFVIERKSESRSSRTSSIDRVPGRSSQIEHFSQGPVVRGPGRFETSQLLPVLPPRLSSGSLRATVRQLLLSILIIRGQVVAITAFYEPSADQRQLYISDV